MKDAARRGGGILIGLALIAAALPVGAVAAFGPARNGVIVFERPVEGLTDLFTIKPDGSGEFNLTNTPGLEEAGPSFAPEGLRVLYARTGAPGGDYDIWRIGIDGTGAVNLTNTPGTLEVTPTFSPDGRRIAFSLCDAGLTNCELAVMPAAGGTPVPLTSTPAPSLEFDPEFAPDGDTIAYRVTDATQRDIWTIDAAGGGARPVTSTPASDSRPDWSPDGRTLAFDTFLGMAPGELLKTDPLGTSSLNFTNTGTGNELEPAFSPDGRLIALADCIGDNCEIAITPVGAYSPTDVTATPPPADERSPDWQPLHRCGRRTATIVGDEGPDVISGTKRNDTIAGLGGRDTIRGRGAKDRICGGKGKDRLFGGGGADLCAGGKGADRGKSCERGKL